MIDAMTPANAGMSQRHTSSENEEHGLRYATGGRCHHPHVAGV
jgi:hypothetical protein